MAMTEEQAERFLALQRQILKKVSVTESIAKAFAIIGGIIVVGILALSFGI
jgi:hypothetical protein